MPITRAKASEGSTPHTQYHSNSDVTAELSKPLTHLDLAQSDAYQALSKEKQRNLEDWIRFVDCRPNPHAPMRVMTESSIQQESGKTKLERVHLGFYTPQEDGSAVFCPTYIYDVASNQTFGLAAYPSLELKGRQQATKPSDIDNFLNEVAGQIPQQPTNLVRAARTEGGEYRLDLPIPKLADFKAQPGAYEFKSFYSGDSAYLNISKSGENENGESQTFWTSQGSIIDFNSDEEAIEDKSISKVTLKINNKEINVPAAAIAEYCNERYLSLVEALTEYAERAVQDMEQGKEPRSFEKHAEEQKSIPPDVPPGYEEEAEPDNSIRSLAGGITPVLYQGVRPEAITRFADLLKDEVHGPMSVQDFKETEFYHFMSDEQKKELGNQIKILKEMLGEDAPEIEIVTQGRMSEIKGMYDASAIHMGVKMDLPQIGGPGFRSLRMYYPGENRGINPGMNLLLPLETLESKPDRSSKDSFLRSISEVDKRGSGTIIGGFFGERGYGIDLTVPTCDQVREALRTQGGFTVQQLDENQAYVRLVRKTEDELEVPVSQGVVANLSQERLANGIDHIQLSLAQDDDAKLTQRIVINASNGLNELLAASVEKPALEVLLDYAQVALKAQSEGKPTPSLKDHLVPPPVVPEAPVPLVPPFNAPEFDNLEKLLEAPKKEGSYYKPAPNPEFDAMLARGVTQTKPKDEFVVAPATQTLLAAGRKL